MFFKGRSESIALNLCHDVVNRRGLSWHYPPNQDKIPSITHPPLLGEPMAFSQKILIGVSACLVGEKVRHDGGSKKQAFLCDVLAQYFNFLTICPEVDIGLGVPRPTIHLRGDPKSPKLVFVKEPNKDITAKMRKYSTQKVATLGHLSGYIFKKNSPTCGPDVKVYQPIPIPPKMGQGRFYHAFTQAYPWIPVEDEGRLNDPALKENFIERVFVYHRWQTLIHQGLTAKRLIDFHTQHKLALMAHNVSAYKRLGHMMAHLKKKNLETFSKTYLTEMMRAFKFIAKNKKVTNVLHHCLGYLKKHLSPLDKKELCDTIEQYSKGKYPLIVPITLLKHHFMHFPNAYMAQQSFLFPYPDELMLRNKI